MTRILGALVLAVSLAQGAWAAVVNKDVVIPSDLRGVFSTTIDITKGTDLDGINIRFFDESNDRTSVEASGGFGTTDHVIRISLNYFGLKSPSENYLTDMAVIVSDEDDSFLAQELRPSQGIAAFGTTVRFSPLPVGASYSGVFIGFETQLENVGTLGASGTTSVTIDLIEVVPVPGPASGMVLATALGMVLLRRKRARL